MVALRPMQPTRASRPRRIAVGRGLIAAGILSIVLAALHLASAGYGSSVRRGFANRRSYDMVKPDVHRALPRTFLLGIGGLAVVLVGARLARVPR
jgi:hypothetical protein